MWIRTLTADEKYRRDIHIMEAIERRLRRLGYEFRSVDDNDRDNHIHMVDDVTSNEKLIFHKAYSGSNYSGHLCFYRGGLYGCDAVGCWRFVDFGNHEHVKYFLSTLGLA